MTDKVVAEDAPECLAQQGDGKGDRASPSHITLERFNSKTRAVLQKFDDNGDGRIDANEIQAVVTTLVAEKFKSKAFRIGLIILGVFTVILLGAMFGLTWAVVAALKDTEVQGSTLVDKSSGDTLQVANVDMTIDPVGRMVARDTSSVIATAAYMGALNVNQNTTFDELVKLTVLKLHNQATGASVQVTVLGVARVPSAESSTGWAVKLHTSSGLIVIEDHWSVEGEADQLFLDAGLVHPNASATGRRLLSHVTGHVGGTNQASGYSAYSGYSCSKVASSYNDCKSAYLNGCGGSSSSSAAFSAFLDINAGCDASSSCYTGWGKDTFLSSSYCKYSWGSITSMDMCCS